MVLNRKLFQASERSYILQAQQTIKNDPVLAFVELITNSDDSYRKQELDGMTVSGKILIQIIPKRKGASVYEIYDDSLGMNDEEMVEKITKYGEDQSGLTEQTGGRSYFGRGLKECMIAFGKAEVRSIKDGIHYECGSEGAYVDMIPKKRKANSQDYEELNIPNGKNGTRVRLFGKNPKLKTPRFEKLCRSLSLHYSLRDIMSNPKRHIKLRYVDQNTKGQWITKNEGQLIYEFKKGEKVADDLLKIDKYPVAEIHLEVFKSEEEIGEALTKYEDERGFLICSKDAIHDVYHFGFTNHEASGLLFGRVTCLYIDHMLRTKNEAVINASRDGMHWSHLFCAEIENVVKKALRPLFEKESRTKISIKRKYENEETSKRVRKILDFFNKIAEKDFNDLEGAGSGKQQDKTKGTATDDKDHKKRNNIPTRIPNGLIFSPNFVRMNVTEPKTITLKVELVDGINENSIIEFESNTPSIQIERKRFRIQEFSNHKNMIEEEGEKITLITTRNKIKCDEVGTEGIITATCNGKKAELEVYVTEDTHKSGGLFSDYRFNPEAPLEQRVQFIRGSGIIEIATKAPSIVRYLGPNGEDQDTPEAQSLLAELILDTCCAELVRLKFKRGDVVYFDDDPSAISDVHNFEMIRYKNRLAEMVHKLIAKQ